MKTILRSGQPPLLSIIIPVFNKCDLTTQCLKSLAKVSHHIPHEIIIVDNASSDATPQRMQNQPAHIHYLRNEVNRNFAGACNQGAAAATAEYLLFLNNDTIPMQGWLDALLDEVRTRPEVAAVGSKLPYENGLVQHAGVAFARENRSPFHPHRMLRMDDPRVNRRRELQAVTAACVLMRSKWFNECGGFNEEFRNGYEDLDLCLKIRQRGGVIVYQPKSVVIHLESQTPGRMKFDNDNRALFFQRWQNAVLSDEDAYYFPDGCYKVGLIDDRPEAPKLIRFANETERTRWSRVAQSQLFAAQWRREELISTLSEPDSWPQEASVRRWAGCLCQRLNLKDAAQKHFAAAIALENDAEIRLLMSETDFPSSNSFKENWAAPLKSGFKNLRCGNSDAAQTAFELALFHGAPPNLALSGLWRVRNQRDDSPDDAQMTRQALLHLPRLDPGTARNIAQPQTVSIKSKPAGKLVSIIILVLNQLEHTRACLESLAAHVKVPHEIIVVDNGSTDGTPEFLRQWRAAHENRAVIRNETNRGFSGGNNQGLFIARGDYLVLLNNDTIVTRGWLENLLDVFNRHPGTGIAGPVSNNVSGRQRVEEAPHGDLQEMPSFAEQWMRNHRHQSFEVSRAVGFCLVVKRQVIHAIGGLDERFGSGNFEDDDFCIRSQLAGFRIRIAVDAFIHHTGSQTFKGAKIDYRRAMQRNWELFKAKWKMPADWTMEKGYRLPASLPDGVSLKTPLPDIAASHQPDATRRLWEEIDRTPKTKSAPVALPPVTQTGQLGAARELFRQKKFPHAWNETFDAISKRPFHPEAFLLLSEIALAAGDSAIARQCAQHARDFAPGWSAPKQFLKKTLHGNAKPEWLKLPPTINSQFSTLNFRLSVCLIVKNEEQFLAQCLKSVRAIAQQIIVVDTGSMDRTVEIAKEFGAEIYSHAWNDDFAAARNAALEHATGDWVLMLDADEELPEQEHQKLCSDLKKSGVIAQRLPLFNHGNKAEGPSFVPRLFRNAPGVFYSGRVHEQVFPSLLALGKSWGLQVDFGTAQLLHHGYTKEMVRDRNKIERNLKLLRQAVEENPTDANLMMNFGLELVRSDDLAGGVVKYREAFELMSAQAADETAPELREVLLTQFTCQLYKIRAYEEVVRVLNSPLAKRGGLAASHHYALGLAQFELKNFGEAAAQMRQCLAKRQQRPLSPINTDILTVAPEHCLALSLAKMGDAAGAEKLFQKILAEPGQTNSENVKLDYAKFLAGQNRFVEALQKLHELVAANARNFIAWRAGGEIALSKPEFLEFARDWTGEAVRYASEDFVVVAQRAEALMLGGDTAAALEFWERVWNAEHQPRALAALILCQTVETPTTHAPDDAMEPASSRAFIAWYQRLIAMRGQTVIVRINEQTDKLSRALPTAAKMIETALAETLRQRQLAGTPKPA